MLFDDEVDFTCKMMRRRKDLVDGEFDGDFEFEFD